MPVLQLDQSNFEWLTAHDYLYSAHRAVIFATAQLSCYSISHVHCHSCLYYSQCCL